MIVNKNLPLVIAYSAVTNKLRFVGMYEVNAVAFRCEFTVSNTIRPAPAPSAAIDPPPPHH
ncbi:MAG: hypothetical protein ABL931_23385, partial [Usitatibacteraceae bacterium]